MPLVGALGPEIFHPMTARESVVAEARSWLDTPFHHQASVKGAGADCIGLLAGCGRPMGFSDGWFGEQGRRYRGYGPQPDSDQLLAACNEMLDPIPVAQATVADILLFHFHKLSLWKPRHFGLISSTSPMSIVHAWSQIGRVVEMPLDRKWMARIHSAYRFRGI